MALTIAQIQDRAAKVRRLCERIGVLVEEKDRTEVVLGKADSEGDTSVPIGPGQRQTLRDRIFDRWNEVVSIVEAP